MKSTLMDFKMLNTHQPFIHIAMTHPVRVYSLLVDHCPPLCMEIMLDYGNNL